MNRVAASFAAALFAALAPAAPAQDRFGEPPQPAWPQQQPAQQPQQQPAYPGTQQGYPGQQAPPQQQAWPGARPAQSSSPQPAPAGTHQGYPGPQAPPPQPAYPGPAPGAYAPPPGATQPGGAQPNFALAAQMESQDFGVRPQPQLHAGQMHGATPVAIPGGSVVGTEALWSMLQADPAGIAIFDVLGGAETLPNALPAVPAAQAGSFEDQTQQQFGQFLQQVTRGNRQMPLVFYCLSRECWMSYNASLRAIALGYQRVLWYRGGIEAWKAAGLPTRTAWQPSAGGPMP